MKAILIIAIALAGCSSRLAENAHDRFALILQKDGSSGCAVSMGEGYFITAAHVVDSVSFILITKDGQDSLARTIDEEGDVALIKSRLDSSMDEAEFGDFSLGEKLYFVQPAINDGKMKLFLIETSAAGRDSSDIFLRERVFPGASGSPVWDERGRLVGIVHMVWRWENGVERGVATFVPERIKRRFLVELLLERWK